jgi:predicted acetyltransferase
VGFVCIAQRPFRYMPEDAERCLAELFVVHHARGTGAALEGARAALGTAPGARWYLRALRGNQPALRFWTRALPALGASDLVQAEEGEAVSFRFRAPKSL